MSTVATITHISSVNKSMRVETPWSDMNLKRFYRILSLQIIELIDPEDVQRNYMPWPMPLRRGLCHERHFVYWKYAHLTKRVLTLTLLLN